MLQYPPKWDNLRTTQHEFTSKCLRIRLLIVTSSSSNFNVIKPLLNTPIFTQHYGDVIMGAIASQITSLTVFYSTVYLDADQRKHQSSASLAFVRGIHRGPENSPHKWPVTRKMFPFDDVIMKCSQKELHSSPIILYITTESDIHVEWHGSGFRFYFNAY